MGEETKKCRKTGCEEVIKELLDQLRRCLQRSSIRGNVCGQRLRYIARFQLSAGRLPGLGYGVEVIIGPICPGIAHATKVRGQGEVKDAAKTDSCQIVVSSCERAGPGRCKEEAVCDK